ncbi:MAG TPA: hypothetical protein PK293_09145 [Spirochaetota bacterium]|nr:hypothetical protein [Spirochaetota bacterium]HPF06187.1 hypothetical protein [Spirochaetota bacterium]
MGKLVFEKITENGKERKLYFTSYLRTDFVERSLVVTLRKNSTVKEIFLSSYHFGSVEWKSGTGLVEPRLWESEEQAVSPSYLTRRYTVRMANGPATVNLAVEKMIPDVLDNMENSKLAETIASILAAKKSNKKIEAWS